MQTSRRGLSDFLTTDLLDVNGEPGHVNGKRTIGPPLCDPADPAALELNVSADGLGWKGSTHIDNSWPLNPRTPTEPDVKHRHLRMMNMTEAMIQPVQHGILAASF